MYERIVKYTEWTEEESILYLSTYLEDNAQEWYSSNLDRYNTFNDAKEDLLAQFGIDTTDPLKRALDTKYDHKTDIKPYFDNIKRYTGLAGLDLKNTLSILKQNLPSSIKDFIGGTFLLGLALIAAFSLEISPSLQIFQHLNVNRIERREEILPSKTYQENFETNLHTLSTPITPLHFSQINQLVQQYSPISALDKYNVGLISSSKCDIELNSHPDQFKTLPMLSLIHISEPTRPS